MFAKVDVCQHRRKLGRSSCLYLDKAKHISLDRNNVYLVCHLRAGAVASDRYLEIRYDKPIAILDKIIGSQRLADIAESNFGLRTVFVMERSSGIKIKTTRR